jgi:hypothetical protein
VKGYRLLISSTDKLIIERSVKFEESLSHAPQLPHADTFYLPHDQDDDSVHSDADTEHADAEVEHADAETESSDTNPVHAYDDPHPSPDRASSSESTSPVINQRTRSLSEIYAQDHPAARNGLVGDNSDLGGLAQSLLSLLLPSLPLNQCHPNIVIWFSLLIHSLMLRLLGIPLGSPPWRRSITPSSRTRPGIWSPFLQEGNLSDANGSTRPRVLQMGKSVDRKPG